MYPIVNSVIDDGGDCDGDNDDDNVDDVYADSVDDVDVNV